MVQNNFLEPVYEHFFTEVRQKGQKIAEKKACEAVEAIFE